MTVAQELTPMLSSAYKLGSPRNSHLPILFSISSTLLCTLQKHAFPCKRFIFYRLRPFLGDQPGWGCPHILILLALAVLLSGCPGVTAEKLPAQPLTITTATLPQ